MRWIFLKAKLGVIFNLQNSQLLTLSLPTEEIFQVHSKSWQVFQQSIFVLSGEKCHYQGHWIRNFRFFLLVFWFTSSFLGKFECHCLSAIRIFQCFSSHNPGTFRQTTLNWEWWRLCRSFINNRRERRLTCQQLIGYIKHTWKISYFSACVVRAFQGCESRCIWLSLLGLSEQRLSKNHQMTAKKILYESSSWSRRTPIFDPHLANTSD